MNNKPVIFLAFANDRVDNSRYLRNLPAELRQIAESLEPAVEAGLCELVTISNVTVSQIMDTFQKKRYRDRIAVFHYGGHADGYQLILESDDGKHDVAHGKGLVSFFKKQKGLQFIFLNGCSTEQQSQELVDAGVPIVIGTASSIADDVATQLAVRFYKSLGNGNNIERSWQEAKDEINIRKGSDSTRGLGFNLYRKGIEQDTFPWRFLVKAGAELSKSWNLPDASENPLFGLPQAPVRDLPAAPFRFLKWYEAEHSEIFFGRAHYIRELFERITYPDGSPLILLYGRSGVGKSSLLDAGLLPRLKQDHEIVYLRRSDGVPLLSSLHKVLSIDSEQQATSVKEAWLEREKTNGKPLVVILDQIEEIYAHISSTGEEELTNLLEAINVIFEDISNRPKGKIILSYRKEYHPEIEKSCLENRIAKEQIFLQPLQRRDVIEVVKGLASTDRLRKKYGLQIDELLPSIIADDLVADEKSAIAPVLQILLTKMWQMESESNPKTFRLENYQRLKKEGILVNDFFEQQIQKIKQWNPTPETSGLILDLLNYHTTDLGTANSRNLEEISMRYQHREEILDQLISKFKELYLLTDIGKGKTSLAHDTLAPIIQNKFKKSDRPGQRATRILENKIAHYSNKEETIIDEEDLELVEKGKNGMRIWIKKEEELVEKSRQRREALQAERQRNKRFKQFAVLALALFAGVVSWLGYNANQEARANELTATALEIEKSDATQALRFAEQALSIRPKNNSVRKTLGNIYSGNEFYNKVYKQTAAIRSLSLSPDKKMLLTGDVNGMLWRWNENGTLIDTIGIHDGGITAITFSQDGQYYATTGEDMTIKVWNKQGSPLQTMESEISVVTSLAFSPDGKQLLTGDRDQTAQLWDWANNTPGATLAGHEGIVYSVGFSPDQQFIITGSEDATAKIWSRDGELLNTLSEHNDRVLCTAFSSDGQYILTGSRDKTAILWDSEGNKLLQLFGHTARINGVQFSKSGESFFTAGDDRVVIQWDSNGNQIARYQGHSDYVNALTLSEDGSSMFTGSEDGSVKKWLLGGKTKEAIPHFDQQSESLGYSNGIGSAVFSPDGALLATAGYKAYVDPVEEEFDMDDKNQLIKIRELSNGKTLVLSGHEDGILSIAFSPDGKQLISGSKDGTARLWDATTGDNNSEGKIISSQMGEVSVVAYSQDGSLLLTAGQDSLCRIWNQEGVAIRSVAHGDWITATAISNNGKQIATGGMDQKIRLWDDNNEEPAKVLSGHQATVIALAYSSDGKYLASGGEDNVLNIWDQKGNLVLTKQQLGKNLSGIGAIRSIAFSKNNKFLVLSGEDGTATVMDLQGNIIQNIKASTKGISSVGFSPDGKTILTAGDDGIARLNLMMKGYLESEQAARFPE